MKRGTRIGENFEIKGIKRKDTGKIEFNKVK
jgi:hypothetical protein